MQWTRLSLFHCVLKNDDTIDNRHLYDDLCACGIHKGFIPLYL